MSSLARQEKKQRARENMKDKSKNAINLPVPSLSVSISFLCLFSSRRLLKEERREEKRQRKEMETDREGTGSESVNRLVHILVELGLSLNVLSFPPA